MWEHIVTISSPTLMATPIAPRGVMGHIATLDRQPGTKVHSDTYMGHERTLGLRATPRVR
jgi:hypothetical protein